MRVKATRMGFYDNERKRPGAVFFLHEDSHFSKSWMEIVDKKAKVPAQKKQKVEPIIEPAIDSEPDDVI